MENDIYSGALILDLSNTTPQWKLQCLESETGHEEEVMQEINIEYVYKILV